MQRRASGSNDGAQVGSGGSSNCRPERNSKGTKNEKWRRSSDFSCRSAVIPLSGVYVVGWRFHAASRTRRPILARLQERRIRAEIPRKSDSPTFKEGPTALGSLDNGETCRTSVTVEPGPAGKDSRNIQSPFLTTPASRQPHLRSLASDTHPFAHSTLPKPPARKFRDLLPRQPLLLRPSRILGVRS